MSVPVAFIIYNRPEKTRSSFAAIQQCKPEFLYVIADGPKDADDQLKVSETRAIVKQIEWECRVTEIFAEENLGCGANVVQGLSRVFDLCEQAIIIEDDVIVSQEFFGFCAVMLERYATDERVMAVNGWNGLGAYEFDKYAAFFSKTFKPWGWASWRRAWQKYNFDPQWTADFVENRLNEYFNEAFAKKIYSHVYMNRLWLFDPWAFQWALAIYIYNAYIITPTTNLTQNIGFDTEGTNFKTFDLRSQIPIRTNLNGDSSFYSTVKHIYDADSDWYDSGISLLNTFCMYDDIRKVFLVYKNPGLIPKNQSKTGWECQLRPFVKSAQCLEIINRLEAFTSHPALYKYKQTFEKVLDVLC